MLEAGGIGYGMPKSKTAGKGKTGMGGPVTISSKAPKKPVEINKKPTASITTPMKKKGK
jgi:hypothetical protein